VVDDNTSPSVSTCMDRVIKAVMLKFIADHGVYLPLIKIPAR
jgi:hypothetical protein